MDRYVPPFLGRRRGWLLITQILVMISVAAMSLHDPKTGLQMLAVNAVLIAFFSASQDVVVDAYRTDVLTEKESAAGAAIWVLGYRIALLVAGSLAFVLADRMPWPVVYLFLAGLMLLGIGATFWSREPVMAERPPSTFAEAVVLPFRDFFTRSGPLTALLILVFIVLYKLPDYYASAMATPFLIERGFSLTEIGAIRTGIGLGATIVGALAGGVVVARLGINKSLWVLGGLQAVSNLAYYGLALSETSRAYLIAAIVVENFCTGMVTTGFIGFLAAMCSVRFSATQFALLTSLMGVSRDLLTTPSGRIAEATGWPTYFLLTLAAALPGLLLLPLFAPWSKNSPRGAAVHPGATTDEPATS
jgi:MFS transporter, PAT family, beta-lactamase induction signal transducer AmpG